MLSRFFSLNDEAIQHAGAAKYSTAARAKRFAAIKSASVNRQAHQHSTKYEIWRTSKILNFYLFKELKALMKFGVEKLMKIN